MKRLSMFLCTGLLVFLLYNPHSARADDKDTAALMGRIQTMLEKLKLLQDSPNATEDDKNCYSMVYMSLNALGLNLAMAKVQAAQIQPPIDALDNMMKANTLTQAKNCQAWSDQSSAKVE